MSDDRAPRVVVGVDGSASSLGAVEWAGDYAAGTGAPIELVAAWEWPNSYGWAIPLPDGYDASADAKRVLSDASAKLLARHPDLSVTTTTVEGHPAQVLVELSRGAVLLVVGSRGHGQFAGMIMGSVSEHCAAQAHCPVLVFHTPRSHPQD
ncbi:MAG TPA: universal stress protein [Acidimicrobiales bacterium]|nr:universal stress protein [Acidimicrobiales bacterium]